MKHPVRAAHPPRRHWRLAADVAPRLWTPQTHMMTPAEPIDD
jgi:hypothetical protein